MLIFNFSATAQTLFIMPRHDLLQSNRQESPQTLSPVLHGCIVVRV